MGIITAHSGCDGTKDNSLEFIIHALASEADCLEVDVRNDKDGCLFLSHDGEAGEYVKLEEAFALLKEKPEKKINCDLKVKGLEIPVYRLALQFHVEKQLIYSGDVDIAGLADSKKEFEEAELFLNIENLYPEVYREIGEEIWFQKLENAIREAGKLPVSSINAEYHILTDKVLNFLKENGLGCSAWTVNDGDAIRYFLTENIANITTRNLKEALKIKKEMEKG